MSASREPERPEAQRAAGRDEPQPDEPTDSPQPDELRPERRAPPPPVPNARRMDLGASRRGHFREQTVLEDELVGEVIVGANSFVLQANEDAKRMLRIPLRDLLRSRFSAYVRPSSRKTYERARQHTLTTGEPQRVELRLAQRGAAAFWAQLDLAMQLDAESGTRLCAITMRGIEEKRLARESRARLAALVQSSSDAIFSRDGRGCIVTWNPSAQALLGYTAEEIRGQPFHVLVPPEHLREEQSLQNRIREGSTLSHHEAVRMHKDGTRVPVSITVSPIYGDNGQIVGISEIARDIRVEKRAEEEMRQQMAQLDLLSSTGQTLIMGDATDEHMWENLFGNLCSALHCRSCCMYRLHEQDSHTLHLGVVASDKQSQTLPDTVSTTDALSGQVAQRRAPLVTRLEASVVGAEAGALAAMGVKCYAGYPLVAHGRLLGVVAFGTAHEQFPSRALHVMPTLCDQIAATLERVRLVGELLASENALKEADRRKDEFIATLAHELRNPLAPIRNAAVALRYGTNLDPKLQWCRDVIERQVKVMAELLEDLLDVSRMTRRRIELRLERLELARVVSQAVETVRPLIDELQHTLSVVLPAETIIVNGDPTRLTQVLGNLLNNAAKYTERGGRIRLTVQSDGRDAVIRVKDSGIGIDPQHLPKVFELFSQVESALSRSRGGLGIGLALTQALVKQHGGHISAASEGVGRGAEFEVRLPIVEIVPAEDAVADLPGFAAAPEKSTGVRRVLVVDDNADVAKSLENVLRSAGHDVRMATDGEHGIQLAEQFRPHAVLLDIGMPHMNGYEVCRRIREQPWGRRMLMIACTGWGRQSDRALAKEAGFDHHLVKPADPEHLLHLVDKGLRSDRPPAGP